MSEQSGGYQYLPSVLNNIELPLHILNSDRVWLARLFNQMGFKQGAEIGVEGGAYSEILCSNIPDLHLICVDLWKPYDGYVDYVDPTYLEGEYHKAVERLKPYSVEILRTDSMNAMMSVENNSLDFVYIDANHDCPWIDNDIYWWSRKVREGGIVSGHDYAVNHNGVRHAVDYFTKLNNIRPWFVTGMVNETGNPDTIPSWFWEKGANELAR